MLLHGLSRKDGPQLCSTGCALTIASVTGTVCSRSTAPFNASSTGQESSCPFLHLGTVLLTKHRQESRWGVSRSAQVPFYTALGCACPQLQPVLATPRQPRAAILWRRCPPGAPSSFPSAPARPGAEGTGPAPLPQPSGATAGRAGPRRCPLPAAGPAPCGQARPCRGRRWRSSRRSPPSTASRTPARCWRSQVTAAAPAAGPLGALPPARPREEALRGRCPPPAHPRRAAGRCPALWVRAVQGRCGGALGGKGRAAPRLLPPAPGCGAGRWERSGCRIRGSALSAPGLAWRPLLRARILEVNCGGLCCCRAGVSRQDSSVGPMCSHSYCRGQAGCAGQVLLSSYQRCDTSPVHLW